MATLSPSTTRPELAGLPPGVYERLAQVESQADVRLDVAAFVGLTERGPPGEAVGVDSMSAFTERFGRLGGNRQLPDAVQLFFANGGREAVVVRAVGPAAATARGHLPGVVGFATALDIEIEARDPGLWGSALQVAWRWERYPLAAQPVGGLMDAITALSVGTLLRATLTPAAPAETTEVLRFVIDRVPQPDGRILLIFDAPEPAVPEGSVMSAWEELRGRLVLRWAETAEMYSRLAVDPAHPAWVGNALEASRLARLADPTVRWVPSAPLLGPGAFDALVTWVVDTPGSDGAETTPRTVFVAPLSALDAWDDLHQTEPISLVALPDLLHLEIEIDPVTTDPDPGDTRFGDCVRPEPELTAPVDLDWPLLSAAHDPNEVHQLQFELIEHCGPRRRIALLDLPPGLDAGGLLAWRAAHAADRAAAYAPWLQITDRERIRPTPPCGAVAGVFARLEAERGVHAAPANAPVFGTLGTMDDPLLPDPGFLHTERIDALRITERGLMLMGARTTSLDPDWTHLNVRRVVDWLARQLALDARWATFEPNDRRLWRRLIRMAERRLTALGAAGAWAGATAAQSWFVRCDSTTTTQADRDAGRVIVHVGVAPAVPAEFIVFELALVVGASDG